MIRIYDGVAIDIEQVVFVSKADPRSDGKLQSQVMMNVAKDGGVSMIALKISSESAQHLLNELVQRAASKMVSVVTNVDLGSDGKLNVDYGQVPR